MQILLSKNKYIIPLTIKKLKVYIFYQEKKEQFVLEVKTTWDCSIVTALSLRASMHTMLNGAIVWFQTQVI